MPVSLTKPVSLVKRPRSGDLDRRWNVNLPIKVNGLFRRSK